MEEKRIKFGMEMKPSLRKGLKSRALERGQKVYEVFEEAVEQFLGTRAKGPDFSGIPKKYRPDVERFAALLASAQEDRIETVLSVLRLAQPDPEAVRGEQSHRA